MKLLELGASLLNHMAHCTEKIVNLLYFGRIEDFNFILSGCQDEEVYIRHTICRDFGQILVYDNFHGTYFFKWIDLRSCGSFFHYYWERKYVINVFVKVRLHMNYYHKTFILCVSTSSCFKLGKVI